MRFVPTPIAGAFEVRHDVRSDARGRFKRQYCEREFADAGLNTRWVQVNHSVTLGAARSAACISSGRRTPRPSW